MDTGQLTLDPTRALPAASYRDPAWLGAEKDSIWHGDWVFVTTEDALPSPGDQLPIKVGDQPVLLLPNQAGELAALSNLTSAVLDRLLHHAETVTLEGNSFRMKDVIDK